MVLRGTKTHPDKSIDDAEMAIRRAQDYLRQQRAALKQAGDDLRSAAIKLERRHSLGQKVEEEEL